MSTRLPSLAPADLDDAQAALYDRIAGGPRAAGPQHFALTEPSGALRGPFNAFLLAPDLGDALQELGSRLRYRGGLPDRSREIVILLVARHWQSTFEREAHEGVGRAAGLMEDELEALRRGRLDPFEGEEATIARLTLALLDGDLDDSDWNDAASSIGEAAVFEVSTLVGYYGMLALQLRVFRAG
ncbi:carboxymuconolactone decarboxylase family protein [Leifsonia shinshuensis]|uniref:4-carboxymuconolactone decarboxylase n=1 Tax=Leifsonia shinshuensis TaxID=150026 RepID=A0A853D5B1_9MICO|nr:carboxymuconolactone decarboxylase family protein [Leifsonia shinshuensis]NYJ25815.1 4-carboxymuconolactone decarboxylase [Leifsonia shinshuensis]